MENNDMKETKVEDSRDTLIKNLSKGDLAQLADLRHHEGWTVIKRVIAEYVKGIAIDSVLFGSVPGSAEANAFRAKGIYEGSDLMIDFVERANRKIDRKKKK